MTERTLELLDHAGILNEQNRYLVGINPNPNYLKTACEQLQKAGILNQACFDLVLSHPNLPRLSVCLMELRSMGYLDREKFDIIVKHKKMDDFTNSLGVLRSIRMETYPFREDFVIQDEFARFAKHDSPIELSYIMEDLYRNKLLTPFNQEFICAHPQPYSFAEVLFWLNRTGILTPEKQALLSGHPRLREFATLLTRLAVQGRLTQDTFNFVTEDPDPERIVSKDFTRIFYPYGGAIPSRREVRVTLEEQQLTTLSNEIKELERILAVKQSDYSELRARLSSQKTSRTFEFSGSGVVDERRMEELSSEIMALKASLNDKKEERDVVEELNKAMKETRRIKAEEEPLLALFFKVFQLRFLSCQVDPETDITIFGYINHSAASRLIEILGPMANGELEVKCSLSCHEQECMDISFPFAKLESIKRGLELSDEVDLSEFAIRSIRKC